MNPIVLGKGYLGTAIAEYLKCPISNKIEDIEGHDIVINAVGRTGRPNVDWCEANKIETMESNLMFPYRLAIECAAKDIYLAHLGSGCIYHDLNGRPISEEEPGHFNLCSTYSKSKILSENLLSTFDNVLQLRIRMPIDGTDNPRNLINKLLGYKLVLDIQNSMTVIPDFLDAMNKLMGMKRTGIYNIVNPGTMSPFEIMKEYQKLVDPTHEVAPLDIKGLGTLTQASRSNCVLSTKKLESEGILLKPIKERVHEILLQKSPNFSLIR